ncbi:heat shock 70 kDa protein 13-like [Ptychodera flava]|uniref:heat shock 70 kDa protein 13-like n=1 Tax=Ptychodera flava TaxID=63121 RepID=UPI003969D06B
MSTTITIIGTAILSLLLAGYLAQQYLPPPKPKIVGIDLGTTYSCIGVYQAVTGDVKVLVDSANHKTVPSMVAFTGSDVLVGYDALEQAERNPMSTIYDAKRFIGKIFTPSEVAREAARYQFKIKEHNGLIRFVVGSNDNLTEVTPEYVGSRILLELRQTAQETLEAPVTMAVMSVPAEFNELQRNYTKLAAKLAGIDVLRVINEPTAAALAYGLHKKDGVSNVLVVDLGGGTLDVSLLSVQGGMFVTMAMAGNNRLGGQDFNQRVMAHFLKLIEKKFNKVLNNPEDLQKLRLLVEEAKLNLTSGNSSWIDINLQSLGKDAVFRDNFTRETFEELNSDLFLKVLQPIQVVLQEAEMPTKEVDEIVLVGGSTRIPKVRQLIRNYFGKDPNVAIDPELAVAYGVAIQAGIIGGLWPLQVSAIEIQRHIKKIHVT